MSTKKKAGVVKAKAKPKKSKAATKVARKKVTKQPKPSKIEKPEKEETEAKEERQAKIEAQAEVREVVPNNPVPVPTVNVRHQASMKVRNARGFSIAEIRSAGLSSVSASRWRVPFDKRRKTLLPENAEKLKSWLQSPKEATAAASGRKVRARKKE